jgi:hypothetical protein
MRRPFLCLALVACGGSSSTPAPTAYFDLAGALDTADTYWDLPFPSDLRLTADGRPDVAAYPNRRGAPIVTDLLSVVGERKGFPTMPTAYVRFTAAVPPRVVTDVIPATADAPVVLLDIDPASPEKGTRYPVVSQTLPVDGYATSNLVAFAPRPGIVLRAKTTYAYVIRTAFAPGFEPAPAFADLAAGKTPAGTHGAAAATLYTPLWPALDAATIPAADVLVATVFTTGDEVARTRARSEAIRVRDPAVISNLHIDPVDGAAHDGFCELIGTLTVPVYQLGTPPFDTAGRFDLDANDVPRKQGTMMIPLTITLPSQQMPAGGWPLYQFFHGSGGLSSGVVDLGYSPVPTDMPEVGKGPAWVVARYGIAAASSAMPLNPERFPGASDYEYLNINNLSAFPFTFQQGVFEQRLLLDALLALQIPPATVAACTGVTLPSGATAHHFNAAKLVAGGQSMGGMYTNMVGAVEGRFGALVPTGAGGKWDLMILESGFIPKSRSLLGAVLGADSDTLTFVHPGMNLINLGWEIAEPMASMAHLAHRPLDGLPVRHVYEPVGLNDEYFPPIIYDAAALAYGNQEAGAALWPTMQDALGLGGITGLATYPVTANRPDATGGGAHTRVVVQFMGDGIIDSHYLYRQVEAVKHQYSCFLDSYLRTGTPVVPAPAPIASPCN